MDVGIQSLRGQAEYKDQARRSRLEAAAAQNLIVIILFLYMTDYRHYLFATIALTLTPSEPPPCQCEGTGGGDNRTGICGRVAACLQESVAAALSPFPTP